jgi:hypothetical protein
MNNTKTTSKGIKFPDPKPIDYTKFIEPKKQIFINTNKGAIAALVNNEKL